MKKFLLSFSILSIGCASFQAAQAQSTTAFAITGESKGNVNWSVIREIDLSTGAVVRNIYLPAIQKPVQVDASSGNIITLDTTALDNVLTLPCSCQSSSLAAATAYDARQQRLYFTTLFGNELQYIDLAKKQLKIYHVTSQNMKSFQASAGEGDNITRMAFGSDGKGYALTNDGNHIISFTTGKKITITDLGALVDKADNKVSVHTKTSSWGGDLVADDAGNLYLFTVAANVFKIKIATLETEFLGSIKNLPSDFTINAAAVNKDGGVTLASSLQDGGYYNVDIKTLEATSSNFSKKVYNSSDFANSNLLVSNSADSKSINTIVPGEKVASVSVVSVYPNPVKSKLVTVYFDGSLQGKHMLEVMDVDGKKIATKTVDLSAQSQSQSLQLPASTRNGMYVVHVLNGNNKKVFTGNIVVE